VSGDVGKYKNYKLQFRKLTILCIAITQQLVVTLDLTQLIHVKKDPRECKAPIRGEARLLG
jgi:hypothetical protein